MSMKNHDYYLLGVLVNKITPQKWAVQLEVNHKTIP